MEIFKFQLDASGTSVLIYNKDRSIHSIAAQRKYVSAIRDALDLYNMQKVYAMGEISETGKILIGDIVEEQEW